MSRGVEAPLALTAIAVAVGNGWVEAMWNWIYTTTHTGGAVTPNTSDAISTPFKNPIGGAPVGSGTYNGAPKDIIPNNPQTNPAYS